MAKKLQGKSKQKKNKSHYPNNRQGGIQREKVLKKEIIVI